MIGSAEVNGLRLDCAIFSELATAAHSHISTAFAAFVVQQPLGLYPS
jgi:hypothetical protein